MNLHRYDEAHVSVWERLERLVYRTLVVDREQMAVIVLSELTTVTALPKMKTKTGASAAPLAAAAPPAAAASPAVAAGSDSGTDADQKVIDEHESATACRPAVSHISNRVLVVCSCVPPLSVVVTGKR